MSNSIIVFNATKRGASHVKKGTVCQDYSLSYNSPDGNVQVAIVCDGHGGDTYVRSDVGSRLAAEIALANIQGFDREQRQAVRRRRYRHRRNIRCRRMGHWILVNSNGL